MTQPEWMNAPTGRHAVIRRSREDLRPTLTAMNDLWTEEAKPDMAEVGTWGVLVTSQGRLPFILDPSRVTTFIGRTEPGAELRLEDDKPLPFRRLAIIHDSTGHILANCGDGENLPLFNWMPGEQITCPFGSRAIVSFEETMLFLVSRPTGKEADKLPTGAPPKADAPASVILQHKAQTIRSDGQPLLLGSHPLCDLQIKEADPFHAFVVWTADGIALLNLAALPLQINRCPIPESAFLNTGDKISIQSAIISVNFRGTVSTRCRGVCPEIPAYRHFTFTPVAGGSSFGFQVPRTGDCLMVGRSDSADITLNDSLLSRAHARFTGACNFCTVVDNDSTNGTFVDDQRIHEVHMLPGQCLTLGHTTFVMHYGV